MKYCRMMVALMAAGMIQSGLEAAELNGVLKDQRNNVIPNATIKVRDKSVETKTNADGRFSLDLPAGSYTLDVEGGNRVHFHQQVTVSDSGTSLTIQMPYHMDDVIVVRANPLEHTKLDMATPAVVLAGDSLTMNKATTLGDMLEKQPGISMSSFGPAVARPVIRGLAGGRVLITQNQMTVQDASVTSNDHDVALEPLLAEQIEVLKGPATLLYGSGAIGGVVNIADSRINPQGVDGTSGGVEVRLGDSATSEETVVATVTGGDESFVFHLDAFSTETDTIEIPGYAESALYRALEEEEHEEHEGEEHEEEEEAFGVLENSQSEAEGLTAGATWIKDWGYFGAAVSNSTKLYGISGHGHHEEEHEGEEHEGEEEENVLIDMEQTRIDLHAGIETPFSGIEEWFIGFTNTDYEHVELEGDEIGTRFTNDATELRTYMRHGSMHGYEGIFGFQYTDRDFAAIGDEAFVPPSETSSMAFFVIEEKRYENYKLELGARLERQSISVDGFSDVDESTLSFSAGTVIDVGDDDRLAINISSSERAPNVEELYSFGEHLATQTFEVGDPNLGSERAFNIDISYRFNSERFSGELNAYWNSYSDFIYNRYLTNPAFVTSPSGDTFPTGDEFPVVSYTQQDADIRGIEFNAEWQLVTDAAFDLSLGIMADMIEAELDNGDELPRIPPWKSGINLHYDYDRISADLSYTSYGEQDKVGANELPTASFDMLDFELAYRANIQQHDLLVFLKGKNLLDEEARDHASFIKDLAPRAGRSIVLGVRYQF